MCDGSLVGSELSGIKKKRKRTTKDKMETKVKTKAIKLQKSAVKRPCGGPSKNCLRLKSDPSIFRKVNKIINLKY